MTHVHVKVEKSIKSVVGKIYKMNENTCVTLIFIAVCLAIAIMFIAIAWDNNTTQKAKTQIEVKKFIRENKI